MSGKAGGERREGAIARVRHSIRAQYSLATALFLLMVLGLFYVGGRVVLVHLIREAEQQVKEIGLDISRLAYRNAERVKQRNLASSGAVLEALTKGTAPESLLASDGFSDLSLVAVYSSGGEFIAGAARSQPLSAADLAPYAARIAAWISATAASTNSQSAAVGILRVKGMSHYISLTGTGGESSRYVVIGSSFDPEAFAAQVNESYGGVDIRMTNRRVDVDVALSVRDSPKPGRQQKGFGFEPMLSEALNFYSGGFWDFGGNPFEAVFAIRDIAGNAITMIAVSLPKTFSDVTRSALGRLTFFISMVGIILILPVFWFQGRILLNPLTRMTELIRGLGERHRDLDCPRLEWKGKDEFAHLAASVNMMLETISARTVALAQLEMRQRALIAGVPDALAIFDRKGVAVAINKQPEGVAALPGISVGDQVDESAFADGGAAEFEAALARSFEEGRASVHLSSVGGRHFEARLSSMDEHFSLAVVRDVTREYAEHVKRVAAEERAHDSSKRESLTLFAAGIAHDVNNVLSVVLSTAEAALADSGRQADIEVIRDAVKRGSAMTRELMAYAGESNMRLVRAKSNMIIEDVKMLIERVIGDNVSVSYSLAENLPDVDVDLNQFWKVLFNIVKNANEAFAGQPGRIVISTAAMEMNDAKAGGFVSEHQVQTEKGVLFTVFNDGPCIPPAVLPKLFDPYVSTKSLGRGLGLATVRTIVEAHGGALKVTSDKDTGTNFRIYLPPSRLPEVTERTERFAAAQDGTSLPTEVMVVDNDEAILKTCSILLKSLKIVAHVARDRRESLAILRRHSERIGVVLLDADLGGIDTLRLLDAFRLASPKSRIVVSSGSSEEAMAKLFANHPYDGFLGKPYSLAELKSALAIHPRQAGS
jgi:signal transduction histidine kinase/ActR/RegA family two-component response regulator